MPSANPTQPVNNASTSSIRRNIFHTQLSGRPKSSTSSHSSSSAPRSSNPSFQNLPSVPRTTTTQSHSTSSRPSSLRSQSQKSSSTSTETMPPDPLNGDIIARDPTSKRPLLPTLPTLPPHLRLSSSGDEPDHTEDPTTSAANEGYIDALGLEDAMREKQETARIEKSLVEMMYRSRNRAQGHATRHGSDATEGLGADGQELLELVKASLRKKVADMEEERWMYEAEG